MIPLVAADAHYMWKKRQNDLLVTIDNRGELPVVGVVVELWPRSDRACRRYAFVIGDKIKTTYVETETRVTCV